MFHLLASLPPPESAASLGWLMISGASLALAVNQIWSVVDRFKSDPPLHLHYATKKEMQEVHGRIKREREEINRDLAELKLSNAAAREEVRDLFEKLDEKRTTSIGGLHQAVDDASRELRNELKNDMSGVQNKLGELLIAVGRLQGRNDS